MKREWQKFVKEETYPSIEEAMQTLYDAVQEQVKERERFEAHPKFPLVFAVPPVGGYTLSFGDTERRKDLEEALAKEGVTVLDQVLGASYSGRFKSEKIYLCVGELPKQRPMRPDDTLSGPLNCAGTDQP